MATDTDFIDATHTATRTHPLVKSAHVSTEDLEFAALMKHDHFYITAKRGPKDYAGAAYLTFIQLCLLPIAVQVNQKMGVKVRQMIRVTMVDLMMKIMIIYQTVQVLTA